MTAMRPNHDSARGGHGRQSLKMCSGINNDQYFLFYILTDHTMTTHVQS